MNMAPIGILFFILAITRAQNVLLTVKCKPEITGQQGQPSLLECVVHTKNKSEELRIVSWRKNGVEAPLLLVDGKEINQSPGYKFAEPSWNNKNMNVSLLITNTTKANEGQYTCMVAGSGHDVGTINLKVAASAPTRSSISEKINKESRPETQAGPGAEKVFDVPAKWVAPAVVIGSLLVGLLLLLLFRRRRRQSDHLSVPREEQA